MKRDTLFSKRFLSCTPSTIHEQQDFLSKSFSQKNTHSLHALYSKIKRLHFLESCKCLFKLFSSKNILPQKKVAKLPHRREVQHTCIYICPWGFVISSFCKVTNLLFAQFQLFASNCATKKRLPFFVSFFGAFYVDCSKDTI